MEGAATPRVTASYLSSYIGKNVIVVGKVIQLRGDEATLDAEGSINAHLNRDAHLAVGNGVQVIGKVNPDLSIKVLTSLDLGQGVDYNLANTVAEIAHQQRSIFFYD
ncbi:replication factor A protein 3 [Immersiella caudata]|uniref:Replication factor A protein 3 n=1 Tax=Immersiella caudata TaxID=314043 RepID=A0AA39X3L3_9PEZI|nr:replication factor A protein 3 [Immersiella caudata]